MARRTREEWRRLVAQWRGSGETKATFARRAGVNANTLGWWAWKLGAEASEASLLDVVVDEPVVPPDFQLDVDGVRVLVPIGFDAGELRRLVDVLC